MERGDDDDELEEVKADLKFYSAQKKKLKNFIENPPSLNDTEEEGSAVDEGEGCTEK